MTAYDEALILQESKLLIREFILHNMILDSQWNIKLFKDLRDKLTEYRINRENQIWMSVIEKQYILACRSILVDLFSSNLKIPVDIAMQIVEDISKEFYFRIPLATMNIVKG